MFDKLFRKKSVADIIAKSIERQTESGAHLSKKLRVRDLTALGIAAIIGAGIFSTIGKASAAGGPAVVFLFLFTALACGFAAFAYSEFASMVPASGSAYTYSYVAFGELMAWIIGWALIMEYAIGNITVAISWSDYFTTLINNSTPWHIPEWMTMDYLSARKAFYLIPEGIAKSDNIGQFNLPVEISSMLPAYTAWECAPRIGDFRIILDVPAILIVFLITWVVYRGIEESRKASNIMVIVKVAVVLLVIFVGAFYVDTENWNPFMPNGVGGVLSGISAVFFAYIGFDAISTTAEECKNPQRDLPRGIMYSIIICTVLYVAIALVITGMVSYKELNVGDPLAYVFEKVGNLKWLSGIIAVSAVIAMASVLLVFQLGQPRIWMAMSRDGLLPKAFSRIHPKYKTPSFSTIITGLLVSIPILFVDLSFITDICSLGTLFAFTLVCGGILKLQATPGSPQGKFKTPYINSKYITGSLFILTIVLMYVYNRPWVDDFLDFSTFDEFKLRIPLLIFFICFGILAVLSFTKNLTLIPLLGLLGCLYMMAQLGYKNWLWFTGWLVIGLIIYFTYSIKNSVLAKK